MNIPEERTETILQRVKDISGGIQISLQDLYFAGYEDGYRQAFQEARNHPTNSGKKLDLYLAGYDDGFMRAFQEARNYVAKIKETNDRTQEPNF